MTLQSPALDKNPMNKKSRRETTVAKLSSASPKKSNNNVPKEQTSEIVAVLDAKKHGCLSKRIITRENDGKLYSMMQIKSFHPKKSPPEFAYLKAIVEINYTHAKKYTRAINSRDFSILYISTVIRSTFYYTCDVNITKRPKDVRLVLRNDSEILNTLK